MTRVEGIIATSALLILFGASIPGYAQKPQQEDKQRGADKQQQSAQQPKQQGQGNQSTPKQQQGQNQQKAAQQQQQQRTQQPQQVQNQQNRVQQIQRTQQQQREQQNQQRQVWQQHRAGNWDSQHRSWQQRGGYNGYRIPDTYFRSYYGRNHWFRIYSLPFMFFDGYPRFQYRGYWFSFLDPYPEYWRDNWYETDDVYVDYYDGGYYLFNRRYPGRSGIAISISF
jgi:hypothetical protein